MKEKNMNYPKLWHKSTLLWVFIIAAINGINAISLVSTSPIVATATANPIFQRNSTGKRFKFLTVKLDFSVESIPLAFKCFFLAVLVVVVCVRL